MGRRLGCSSRNNDGKNDPVQYDHLVAFSIDLNTGVRQFTRGPYSGRWRSSGGHLGSAARGSCDQRWEADSHQSDGHSLLLARALPGDVYESVKPVSG